MANAFFALYADVADILDACVALDVEDAVGDARERHTRGCLSLLFLY
jgi:hypothetical protein